MDGIIIHRTRKISISIISIITLLCCCNPGPVEAPVFDPCESQVANFESALNAYNADATNRTKCIAVKEAGTALLNCDGLTESQKKAYQATLDAIFCN